MFVQHMRHNSMSNRKLVTCYYLKESFDKFITGSKCNFLSVCMNITSCLKTTDSKYFSYSKPLHKLLQNQTGCMWSFCEMSIHHMKYHSNRESVTLFSFFPSHDILKGSEWCWSLCHRTVWTHCFVLQIVSNIAGFMKCSEMTPFT